MDHPLTAFDTVRPWRTATLVAVAVAALELVLLVIVGGTLFARHATSAHATPVRAHTAARPAPARLHVTKSKPAALHLTRSHVGVLILNGNGRHGAASSAAARVHGHGYPIRAVGNAQRMDYTRSIVMFRPGFEAEGRRLGRDLGIATVGPLDGLRTAQLHGAKAVLVVG